MVWQIFREAISTALESHDYYFQTQLNTRWIGPQPGNAVPASQSIILELEILKFGEDGPLPNQRPTSAYHSILKHSCH